MSAYYKEKKRTPTPDARTEPILEILRRLDTSGTGLLQRQRLVKLIHGLVPEMSPQSIEMLMDSSLHADQVNVRYQEFITWLFEGVTALRRPNENLEGSISVATWNVAAVNNNPFEYWLAHDDPSYVNLMIAVETCLASPSEAWDVPVCEIFTEEMFQELKDLMLEHGIHGVKEVEESMWRGPDLRLRDRRVVSEFIKDKSLGSKRLISMPDRITNTVQVVTRAPSEYKPPPACRPSVINNYLGDLSTLEAWWESWKRFMFLESLAVRTQQGVSIRRPCHMLEPIPRSKYPAISEKEERLAIPLQILCQAIFDAILVHLMHYCSPDGTWQVVKSQICDHLYRCKAQRTMEILETKYHTVDVIFLQEVASNFYDFFQRSSLATSFHCVLPSGMDGKRDQNSLLLLSKRFFNDSIEDVTAIIEESMEDGVRLVSSDLVAVAVSSRDQRSYLLASFHGDTAGALTLPLLRALFSCAAKRFPRHVLILGLDANSYEPSKAEQLPFTNLIAEAKKLGLSTCFGDDPDVNRCRTTCCARTSLQPQLNKAIRYKDRVSLSDRNPKDLITFKRQQLRLLSPTEVGQTNPVKDNTGQLRYEESMNFPTFDFPSDHAIVAALLQHVDGRS